MRHPRPVTRAVISVALWPLIVIFSPVIFMAGEPVNRYVMRRLRRSATAAPVAVARPGDRPAHMVAMPLFLPASVLLMAISNPLWIALTAPGRWLGDRFRRPPA